jgi:hypothetical protein
LGATAAIDQAIFQVDSHLRVGPFEEPLDLAEERFVHDRSGLTQRHKGSQRDDNISEIIPDIPL